MVYKVNIGARYILETGSELKFINVYTIIYCIRGATMEAVTTRLPKELVDEIERMAEKERADRSEVIRRLLDEALRQKKIEGALSLYREGRATLWKAAEIAGLSLREIMELVKKNKIPVAYSVEDLDRDLDYALRKYGRK